MIYNEIEIAVKIQWLARPAFIKFQKLVFQNPIWFQKLFKACTKIKTIEDFQRPVVTVQIIFSVIFRLFGTLKSMPVKRLKSSKQTFKDLLLKIRYLNEVKPT